MSPTLFPGAVRSIGPAGVVGFTRSSTRIVRGPKVPGAFSRAATLSNPLSVHASQPTRKDRIVNSLAGPKVMAARRNQEIHAGLRKARALLPGQDL